MVIRAHRGQKLSTRKFVGDGRDGLQSLGGFRPRPRLEFFFHTSRNWFIRVAVGDSRVEIALLTAR